MQGSKQGTHVDSHHTVTVNNAVCLSRRGMGKEARDDQAIIRTSEMRLSSARVNPTKSRPLLAMLLEVLSLSASAVALAPALAAMVG